jgi:N-acetylneuraminate synthase
MSDPIAVAGREIGSDQPCFVIAEAGVNHNGEIDLARNLVDVAVAAGADAIKFQTFKADRVVSAEAPKATYQKATTDADESQLEMVRRLELSPEVHETLQTYCQERSILFMSTPFDKWSVDLLDELGVPLFKVGSGEITNWPLLEHIASKQKPIILSTGMSYLGEVDEAVRTIRDAGNDQLVLLHCVSNYPADPADVNLHAMATMVQAFQLPAGLSDHTPGIEVALAAVALGACVVEKHFTLDKTLPGPDHQASLAPQELETLVRGIRVVESALGDGRKRPAASEEENRGTVRRSLAARLDIPRGTLLTAAHLQPLRPATGLPPTLLRHVVGRETKRELKEGELITWSDLV